MDMSLLSPEGISLDVLYTSNFKKVILCNLKHKTLKTHKFSV